MTFAPVNALQPPLDENVSFPSEWEKFHEQITRRYRDVTRAVNDKERAFYPIETEILNSQNWFNTNNTQQYRSAFRKVFNFGAIATGATLNITHAITDITIITRLYGTCISDIIDYRPIPYSSVTAANLGIELVMTSTTISIINGAAAPNITSGIIVVEFLKN